MNMRAIKQYAALHTKNTAVRYSIVTVILLLIAFLLPPLRSNITACVTQHANDIRAGSMYGSTIHGPIQALSRALNLRLLSSVVRSQST